MASKRKPLTPEQKIRAREYKRAWAAKQPKRIRVYDKAYHDAYRAAHAEEKRARDKAYYQANREKVKAQVRLWRKNNPEHYTKTTSKWRANNKERKAAVTAAWAARNKERNLANIKAWGVANPDKVKTYGKLCSARRRGAKGRYTTADINRILKQQNWRCVYCTKSVRRVRHIDHVIPIAKGGTNWPYNIQLTCPACNLWKGATCPIRFKEKVKNQQRY